MVVPVPLVEQVKEVELCSVPPLVELVVLEYQLLVMLMPVGVPDPELHVLYVYVRSEGVAFWQ